MTPPSEPAAERAAFGKEDLSDLLGDHDLMRGVLVQCVDNAWYGGAVFASRTHFDTAERPERRNVAIVRGGARGKLAERLLADGATASGATESGGEEAGRERTPRFMRESQGLLGTLCRSDVVAAYDGQYWVPRRVEDCVHAVNKRFVDCVAGYLREHREKVHDIAPAVEEMVDDYRMGVYRHHFALSEAVAGVLDRHALDPGEFLDMSGLL